MLDLQSFRFDIYKTTMDPLAKVMRRELRQWVLNPLRLCTPGGAYKTKESEENSCSSNCICPKGTQRKCSDRNQVPVGVSFVPSVAGLIIAGV